MTSSCFCPSDRRLEPPPRRHVGRSLLALIVPIAYLAACWPTLSWRAFGDDMEVLNVASALEIRWSGDWALPSLQGEPRTRKPPLAAWLAAATIRQETLAGLGNADAAPRRAAQRALAVQVRVVPLACMALLLVGVYTLGVTVSGEALGLIAAAVTASMLIVQRYAHWCTYDVPLAMAVTWADVFLAQWILMGRRWMGAVGAGVCLGIAILAKGPIALVQAAAPAGVFAAGMMLWGPVRGSLRQSLRRQWRPILVGVLLMVAIAAPWFAYAAMQLPDVHATWIKEFLRTRIGVRPSPVHNYAILPLRLALPWTPVFLVGVAAGVLALIRRHLDKPTAFAAVMLLVPLLMMSVVSDRKGHYLLPLAAPMALLGAATLLDHVNGRLERTTGELVLSAAQWTAVAVLTILAPLTWKWNGGHPLRATHDPIVVTWPLALATAGACAAIISLGVLHERRIAGIVWAPFAAMLLIYAVEAWAEQADRNPPRPLQVLADRIWMEGPGAPVFIHEVHRNHDAAVEAAAELEILLGRVVRWTSNPSELPPGTAVVLLDEEKRRDEARLMWRGAGG